MTRGVDAVGIDAQPRLVEWNTLTARLRGKDFQSVVSGWSVDFKFDPTETLGCSGGDYNYPSYCNPEADSLVRTALTTLDNEEARIIIGQNVPFVTGQYTNTGAGQGAVSPFQTIERQDVGTTITITSSISENPRCMVTSVIENTPALTGAALCVCSGGADQ